MATTAREQRRMDQREKHRRLLAAALAVTGYEHPPFAQADPNPWAEDHVRDVIDLELATVDDLGRTMESIAVRAAMDSALRALGTQGSLGSLQKAGEAIYRDRPHGANEVLHDGLTTVMNLMLLADHLAEDRPPSPESPPAVRRIR